MACVMRVVCCLRSFVIYVCCNCLLLVGVYCLLWVVVFIVVRHCALSLLVTVVVCCCGCRRVLRLVASCSLFAVACCCIFVAACWSLVVRYVPFFVTGAGVVRCSCRWCLLLFVVVVDV